MAAARYDLLLEQGADFVLEVRWTSGDGQPMPLDTYEFRAGMSREFPTDWRGGTSSAGAGAANPSLEFECEVKPGPGLDDDDVIEVSASAAATRELRFPSGVWELDATPLDLEGRTTRLVSGNVDVAFSALPEPS